MKANINKHLEQGYKRAQYGFTLVEVLIAMFILQLIIAPVYLMFTETQKTMYKAADTLTAANLASSIIAGLRELPPEQLREQPLEVDNLLGLPFQLANMGVLPVPEEFTRKVEIAKVDPAGKEGGPFYLVEVEITWFNRKTRTRANYTVRDLLRGIK